MGERALARLVDGRMWSHRLRTSTALLCKKKKPKSVPISKVQLGSRRVLIQYRGAGAVLFPQIKVFF